MTTPDRSQGAEDPNNYQQTTQQLNQSPNNYQQTTQQLNPREKSVWVCEFVSVAATGGRGEVRRQRSAVRGQTLTTINKQPSN